MSGGTDSNKAQHAMLAENAGNRREGNDDGFTGMKKK
jgi:hypothetical protein